MLIHIQEVKVRRKKSNLLEKKYFKLNCFWTLDLDPHLPCRSESGSAVIGSEFKLIEIMRDDVVQGRGEGSGEGSRILPPPPIHFLLVHHTGGLTRRDL